MPEGVGYGPQNTASVGKDIHVIGSHAYAYSGMIQSAASEVSHLSFSSGNYYLVGRIDCYAPTKTSNPNDGNSALFTLSFNGVEVTVLKTETEVEDMPSVTSGSIIIPPFTEVTVTVYSGTATSGYETSCNITGKIYK